MAKVLTAGPAIGPDDVFAPVEFSPVGRVSVLKMIELWWQRQHERTRLAQLDERLLKDIGLARADVDHEVRKQFWQS